MRGGRKLGDLFEQVYFNTQADTWHSQRIRSAAYDDISMDVRGLAFTLAENEGSNGSNDTDGDGGGSIANSANMVPSRVGHRRRRAMISIYVGSYYSYA